MNGKFWRGQKPKENFRGTKTKMLVYLGGPFTLFFFVTEKKDLLLLF